MYRTVKIVLLFFYQNTNLNNQSNLSKLKCNTCSLPVQKLHCATDVICNISNYITKLRCVLELIL